MAKRNHRSRRSQKRQSHRQHRQRGGAGCAALPLNTPRIQQGGMAPFNAPGMLLDHATQVQAQSADQVAAIEAATAMAKAQIGGRRHRSRRQKTHRRKSQRSKSQRSRRQQRSRRRQRGGMMDFDAAFTPVSTQPYGANPQFSTEFGPNNQYTGAGINQLKPAA